MTAPRDIGQVETRFFTFTDGDGGFELAAGDRLERVTLAYEMYGELNRDRSNAILLFHALTGSQHAAGINRAVDGVGERWTEEMQLGWWDDFIGPGKALDTDRYCVLCANYLGGCFGSTGPVSIDPTTNRPYGGRFPRVSFADIVRSQVRLLDHLGIERLHAALGASTGGLACLHLATLFPSRIEHLVLIGSGLTVTPLQRVHNFEQIRAIENDPDFGGGDYELGNGPVGGLALARMISHKTFISLGAMRQRSRQVIEESYQQLGWYSLNHPLESYMLHQGMKFARRFDANSYLRILDAWNRFDLLGAAGESARERVEAEEGSEDGVPSGLVELFQRCRSQRFLVFTIDSDVCYYPDEQDDMVRVLSEAGVVHLRVTVHSDKGHDSFLLEPELYAPHLRYLLG